MTNLTQEQLAPERSLPALARGRMIFRSDRAFPILPLWFDSSDNAARLSQRSASFGATRQSRRFEAGLAALLYGPPKSGAKRHKPGILCCASHPAAFNSAGVIERLTRSAKASPLPAESWTPPEMLVPNLHRMGSKAAGRHAGGFAVWGDAEFE
jgi:hypothetical protein